MNQIEREIDLSEVVLRYRLQDESTREHHVSNMTIDFLRKELGNLFQDKVTPSDPAAASDVHIYLKPIALFQKELGKLIRIPGSEASAAECPESQAEPKKRGRPAGSTSAMKELWEKLDLGMEGDAFQQDATLLFLITLYVLIENMISYVTDGEIDDAVKSNTTADANAEDEDDEDEEEEESETDELYYENTDSRSQQQIYAKIWESIAIELQLRSEPNADKKNSQARLLGNTSRKYHGKLLAKNLRTAFENNKQIDLKKRMEFASTLVVLINLSTPEQWFEWKKVRRQGIAFRTIPMSIIPTSALLRHIRKLSAATLILPHYAPLIEPPIDWGSEGIRAGGFHYRSLPFYSHLIRYPDIFIAQHIGFLEDGRTKSRVLLDAEETSMPSEGDFSGRFCS
jgi:hypothetical protein